MKPWKYKFVIGDIWHNDSLAFEQKRDEIIARMKQQPWYQRFEDETWIAHDLATEPDVDEWDNYWDQFYDWADVERIWVDLLRPSWMQEKAQT